ncbi:MAG: hypothetical protein HN921_16970, partial [Bacteroidetes bacterium]|nr:hypothetical protein [Bacteroidota bacterium]
VQIFLGLGIGFVITLIAPFLSQALVDTGILGSNLKFVYVILFAQLILFFSETMQSLIQSWILLHMSTRINIAILTDFLYKILRLPVGFFDTKTIGDLTQRIGDHERIEELISTSSMSTLFSFTLIPHQKKRLMCCGVCIKGVE